MTTFTMLAFIALGGGYSGTGGPLMIQGFKTIEACEIAARTVREAYKKMDVRQAHTACISFSN